MIRILVLTAILAITSTARAEAPLAADARAQATALFEQIQRLAFSDAVKHAAADLQGADMTKRFGVFGAPLTYRGLDYKNWPELETLAKSCRADIKTSGVVKDAKKLAAFGPCFAVSLIALASADKPESWLIVDPNKPTDVLGKANQKTVKALFGKLAKDHVVVAAQFHMDNDTVAYVVLAFVKQGNELKIDTVLFTPWV